MSRNQKRVYAEPGRRPSVVAVDARLSWRFATIVALAGFVVSATTSIEFAASAGFAVLLLGSLIHRSVAFAGVGLCGALATGSSAPWLVGEWFGIAGRVGSGVVTVALLPYLLMRVQRLPNTQTTADLKRAGTEPSFDDLLSNGFTVVAFVLIASVLHQTLWV